MLRATAQLPGVRPGWLDSKVKAASPAAVRGSQRSLQRLRNTSSFPFLSSISCIQLKSWTTATFTSKSVKQSGSLLLSYGFSICTSLLFVACKFLSADKWHGCQKFSKNGQETDLKWTQFCLLSLLPSALELLGCNKGFFAASLVKPSSPRSCQCP